MVEGGGGRLNTGKIMVLELYSWTMNCQESKWPTNWCTSPMMIHKITSKLCRLQLVVETFGHSTWWPTNQNSIKVAKVVKPTSKKKLLEEFGDQCNK